MSDRLPPTRSVAGAGVRQIRQLDRAAWLARQAAQALSRQRKRPSSFDDGLSDV